MKNSFQVSGNIVDVLAEKIFPGTIHVEEGIIVKIVEHKVDGHQYILPGFIDAHVHIESSMLIPSEFARLAVVHGTVATVSDPHEIANVLGMDGVEYMIENGKQVPFKFYFGAPSCVPATTFETAGAAITVDEVAQLLSRPDIKYLSEMMNWPGVINEDPLVMEKIHLAQTNQKVIDGHAPGMAGPNAAKYIASGISTDHECYTKEEALQKLNLGIKVIIREGSAAKNFDELVDLLHDHADSMMFCSDDKHPDALVKGHINELVVRSLQHGIPLLKVLKAACLNPVKHYQLEVGLLQLGDPADFIITDQLDTLPVLQTYINGFMVASHGKPAINPVRAASVNQFLARPITVESLAFPSVAGTVKIIQAIDGQLVTGAIAAGLALQDGNLQINLQKDILKLVVVNRYIEQAKPAVAFVTGFGLKSGALASSVAHDSHNIIAVGTSDASLKEAINGVIGHRGALAVFDGASLSCLPLPVAGLMSPKDGYEIADEYTKLDCLAKNLGSPLAAPFMLLSFMGLLVIPSLKLSDKGLLDADKFEFVHNN